MRGDRQQVEPELHRILPGRVRQLVDERLEHARERVAARRAQRPVGTPSGISDAVHAKFGTKRAGNSVAGTAR